MPISLNGRPGRPRHHAYTYESARRVRRASARLALAYTSWAQTLAQCDDIPPALAETAGEELAYVAAQREPIRSRLAVILRELQRD